MFSGLFYHLYKQDVLIGVRNRFRHSYKVIAEMRIRMRRIRLRVAYDGTNYSGWQIQPSAITVEKVLDDAIHQLTGEHIHVIGASRTDAGVHSMGNVAVFDTASSIPADRFTYALNRYLPDDVIVQESDEVNADFHPRHCDTKKTYCYRILNTEFGIPQKRNYTWNVAGNIDIDRMKKAAGYLIGEHDFKSFCCVKTQAESTVRTVYSLDVDKKDDEIHITITGNGFLYNMVRIIAGTLIQVGKGRFEPEYVQYMLDACDRTQAGQTAPPQGLTLMKIDYLDEEG